MDLPNFENANILVIGDILLDSYWKGICARISPEAPVPIVNVNDEEKRLGGAANVALNLRTLGTNVTLLGVVGNDQNANWIEKNLKKANIEYYLSQSYHHPTINKLRVISNQQQLIRLDFENTYKDCDKTTIVQHYKRLIAKMDAIILSDYGKGTLEGLHQSLIQLASQHKKPVFVDPKGNDYQIYANAAAITPNLNEFRQAFGDFNNEAEMLTLANQALAQLNLQALLITCGADGMILVEPNTPPIKLPTHTLEVKDVTGAGDTVIASFAASIACGESTQNAMFLSNLAAGITVTKLGTASVNKEEIRYAISQKQSSLGILSQQEAVKLCHAAKQKGEKIVMTNGCFDILHPGHVRYLEEAKSLGDKLLIAVNTDNSVQRNKGPGRPFNTAKERMEVLSALRAVDWVCAFDEDTPEQLIKAITPDILVKGVDYDINNIVGAEHVIANGGEVKTIGPKKQWSSTDLLSKIQQQEAVYP